MYSTCYPAYTEVAKNHPSDCVFHQIFLTSENLHLKNYVFKEGTFLVRCGGVAQLIMPLIKRIPLCGIQVIEVRQLRVVMDPCSIDRRWRND